MRWCVFLALAACGDNVELPRLEPVARLPIGWQDIAFERDGTPVVRTGDSVKQFVDGRWRGVDIDHPVDFGSDNDGGLLVMTSRGLVRLDGGVATAIGGGIVATAREPVQVPSGNRYAREEAGRSFVLSGQSWVETPPMFFSRPVRSNGTLFAMVAAGVQKLEAERTIAVPCEWLERATCTEMVLGGTDGERIFVGADRDIYAVGSDVVKARLPERINVLRMATGKDVTVVLARREMRFFLFAIRDGEAQEIDTIDDRVTANTRLAVHDGVVWVATAALSQVRSNQVGPEDVQ